MARLTDEEFRVWCQHNKIEPQTEAYIQRIRESEPSRKVQSRASNVSGRYPSVKMGFSIQFESQHVELWGIYTMERDEDVLEMYDQPTRIQLHYQARSGRKTSPWHTPDFLVLRRNGASFEEWKQASSLDKLATSQPHRYQRNASGGWQCPPGEQAAQLLGLSYRVRSSAEYHPLYIQNLKLLQDFWVKPFHVEAGQEAQVLSSLQAYPGVSVKSLLDAHPDLPVDVIWAMIVKQSLFTDLSAAALTSWDQVFLYRSAAEVPKTRGERQDGKGAIPLASRLLWDGRLWEAEVEATTVVLRPESGAVFTLTLQHFQRLVNEGVIKPERLETPSPLRNSTREILSRAGPKALEAANRRWREILAYTRGEAITVTARSVQNWMAAFRRAEAESGCGYLGLLDRVAERGNRNPRIPDASKQLLSEYLKSHYAVPQAKRAAAVYRLYREECVKQGIAPIGERTFYRERARFTSQEVTTTRRGKRAAYVSQPFAYLDQTTPRHGSRPFERAHLDHTELDLVLVSSMTGKPLARPWATFMTDAYSRRVLACYVTFDPPSYRSAMMAFRLCVQRYGRLPQELVVDQGPEFGSVYFQSLLTRCLVTQLDRPPQQPRFGSVAERLFGTATTQLLNQLRGNTQASKTPRHMTREVDPKRLAVWTLERFAPRLSEYVHEVYDQMEHPALGQSPREAFEQGMTLSGSRSHRLIPYSEDFLMLTRPSTETGTVKIHPSRGITVNGLHYWHESMRLADQSGKSVPVRYEPFDMGFVYAYIGGQWIECIADAFAQVHGRSEREWNLILDEWREQQRQHNQKRITINGPLLAQFLQKLQGDEALLLQRKLDLEEQAQREAILLKRPKTPEPTLSAPPRIELDLTKISRYEEYR
ncbi:MAG: DDE-type integrase/transposase/recombinase [Chloroflexi bacterium]|nr:MAG: DDE-type integrase/transposase/recombinase [Chloroflexota bacterium]